METKAIHSVTIKGLHHAYDLEISLKPGLNLIYGRNGSGKTTFLHILANLIDRDIERFCQIRFDKITVTTADNATIELRQVEQGTDIGIRVMVNGAEGGIVTEASGSPPALRELLREHLGGRPVYLPAFRSILEAVTRNRLGSTLESERLRLEIQRISEREVADSNPRRPRSSAPRYRTQRTENVAYKTFLCREWFGEFVPVIRYPSLREVAEELRNERQEADLEVAANERTEFRSVFNQVLAALSKPLSESTNSVPALELLRNIQDNLAKLEHNRSGEGQANQIISHLIEESNTELLEDRAFLPQILSVYNQSITRRNEAQEKAFQQLRTFEDSVNRFLKDKPLAVSPRAKDFDTSRQPVVNLGNGRQASLPVLSSGERQVVTMLFSATHMSTSDGVLLIDEPELSLHVDWQRIILGELMKQAGNRQIVACTHAPEVTADHRSRMVAIRSQFGQSLVLPESEDTENEALLSEDLE